MKTCRFCNKTFNKTDICLKHEFICQDKNKFTLKKINFNSFTGEFIFDNILAVKEENSIKLDEYNYISNKIVNENLNNDYLDKVVSSDNLNYCIYTTDFSKEYEIECQKKLIEFDNTNKKIEIEKLKKSICRNNTILKEIKK